MSVAELTLPSASLTWTGATSLFIDFVFKNRDDKLVCLLRDSFK